MTEREYLRYHQMRLTVQAAEEPYIRELVNVYSTNLPKLFIVGNEIQSCSYAPEIQSYIDELHRLAADAAEQAVNRLKRMWDGLP